MSYHHQYSGNNQGGQSPTGSHSTHPNAQSISHNYPMHAQNASQPVQNASYYPNPQQQQQGYSSNSPMHSDAPLSCMFPMTHFISLQIRTNVLTSCIDSSYDEAGSVPARILGPVQWWGVRRVARHVYSTNLLQ